MSDTGTADLDLTAALAAYGIDPTGARMGLLSALREARVFVAVTAAATAQEIVAATGLSAESSAQLSLVSLVGSAGSRAVPAFPDVGALARWRRGVRPVPVRGADLCRAALDDGAVAVLLDPGAAAVLIEGSELSALAAGYLPIPGVPLAVRRTDDPLTTPATAPDRALIAALRSALAGEPITAARLLDGPAGLVLGIAPRRALTPGELAALAGRISRRLGSALPPQGLDLAVVPHSGPGVPITRRAR